MFRFVLFLAIAGAFVLLAAPANAMERLIFAQAGSTGGTVGKQGKSAPRKTAKKSDPAAGAGGNRCGHIVGTWTWSNAMQKNVNVVFRSNGTVDAGALDSGTWGCEGGSYVIRWAQFGNTSRVTMSADGRRMTGGGVLGSIVAVRR